MRGVSIDLGRGTTVVAGIEVAVRPGPAGSLLVGDGVPVRPLTYAERSTVVGWALGCASPRAAVVRGIGDLAAGGASAGGASAGGASAGGASAGGASANGVDPGVLDVLALVLAGARTEGGSAPGFAEAALLVVRASGCGLDSLGAVRAGEVDALAMGIRPEPAEDTVDGWTRLAFWAAGESGDLSRVTADLADDLLARARARPARPFDPAPAPEAGWPDPDGRLAGHTGDALAPGSGRPGAHLPGLASASAAASAGRGATGAGPIGPGAEAPPGSAPWQLAGGSGGSGRLGAAAGTPWPGGPGGRGGPGGPGEPAPPPGPSVARPPNGHGGLDAAGSAPAPSRSADPGIEPHGPAATSLPAAVPAPGWRPARTALPALPAMSSGAAAWWSSVPAWFDDAAAPGTARAGDAGDLPGRGGRLAATENGVLSSTADAAPATADPPTADLLTALDADEELAVRLARLLQDEADLRGVAP